METKLVLEINFHQEQSDVCDQIIGEIKSLCDQLLKGGGTASIVDKSAAYCSINLPQLNQFRVGPLSFNVRSNEESNEFLEKCLKLIVEHADCENFNLPTLADMLNLSKATFYRKIKTITGLSAKEFIMGIKMQIAYQHLTTGKFMVSEVAWKCGYNSVKHFSRIFLEAFGEYPSKIGGRDYSNGRMQERIDEHAAD